MSDNEKQQISLNSTDYKVLKEETKKEEEIEFMQSRNPTQYTLGTSITAEEQEEYHENPELKTETDKPHIMARYLKYASLLILVIQNTALVLTMRYSRTTSGPLYLASTAVVMTELLKFIICVTMVLYDNKMDLIATLELLINEIIGKYRETINLSVPSILYTIQNNLLYIALSYLNAATFQVSHTLQSMSSVVRKISDCLLCSDCSFVHIYMYIWWCI